MENTKSTTPEVSKRPPGKNTRKVLTARELEFVNAYQGSIRGAGRAIGMDQRNAQKMMSQPRVAKAIEKKIEVAIKASGKKLSRYLCMSAEEVNHGIAQLSTYDLRKCVTETNSPIPLKKWGDTEAAALSSFKVTDLYDGRGKDRKKVGELKEFKMADRGQNLERAGRILGMFIERHIDLPVDWDSRTMEDQEYWAEHGYYPTAGV